MRINEDYLDDVENVQDVLHKDDTIVEYGNWWIV